MYYMRDSYDLRSRPLGARHVGQGEHYAAYKKRVADPDVFGSHQSSPYSCCILFFILLFTPPRQFNLWLLLPYLSWRCL